MIYCRRVEDNIYHISSRFLELEKCGNHAGFKGPTFDSS